MTTADEDEFGELVDFNPQEMHAVGKAANGTSFLVAKSADDRVTGGLLSSDQVRELVAKAEADEPEAFRPSSAPVTLSGSPAGLAEMMARIHGAPVRKAEAAIDPELDRVVKSAGDYAAVVKAKYSAEEKRKLLAQGHAMRNADGEPDYPVHDEEDLGKAIHAVGRGGADHDKIRRYVIGRAKAMGKSDQIPDNWAADGSLKAPVSKADATDPGSPTWESADAASAEQVVARILACIPSVRALAMREATEVGAGHLEDFVDVLDLQDAIDSLTCAAKKVGAFAVSEHAEAGETGPVTKAQPEAASSPAAPAAPSPKENTVDQTEVTKAEENAAATSTEAQPVTKAQALMAQLGITPEQLLELGAQSVLKAAADAATQTPGANPAPADARTIPGTDTVQSPAQPTDEVSKAEANSLVTALTEVMAPVVKQLTELTTQVGTQGERVEKMAAKADNTRSPFLNGATGESGPALREAMSASPEWQTVAKALDALPDGPAKDEARRDVALQALRARFS